MKGKKAGSSGRTADLTMADRTGVEQIVEKVVSQVLDSHVPQLRDELVRRVLEELPQATGEAAAGASGEGGSANLLKAISAIQSGTTQREILRALLDNTVRYSGRGALFVVKAGAATGWQGRGFDKDGDDTIKDFALNVSRGVPEQALRSRMPFSGATRDIDPEFVAKFGAPADDQVLVLPLVLKEKVAALVYADAGAEAGGKLDSAPSSCWCWRPARGWKWRRCASRHRKKNLRRAPAEKAESAPPVQQRSGPLGSFCRACAKARCARSRAGSASGLRVRGAAGCRGSGRAGESRRPRRRLLLRRPMPFANLSPEDADVHRKAQRFARLLVDEIKLYNQVKVSEGRKNKDLYDRLKEDIEKSRITYQEAIRQHGGWRSRLLQPGTGSQSGRR